MSNDFRIDSKSPHHYTVEQLRLFTAPGYTFFRDLQPGDTFACGTPEHHGGWFTVAFTNHRQEWVSVDYVNRNGDLRKGYKWRYSPNNVCILQSDSVR